MTTTTAPAQQIRIAEIIPLLTPAAQVLPQRSAAAGFGDATATFSLCRSLVAVLGRPASSPAAGAVVLSHDGIASLGLSVRQAWARAALNLRLQASGSPADPHAHIQTQVRSARALLGAGAPPGVEIRLRYSPISSWLAHPRAFSTIHRYARHCLAEHRPSSLCYLLVADDTLLALTHCDRSAAYQWHNYLSQRMQLPEVGARPLIFSNGFPREL